MGRRQHARRQRGIGVIGTMLVLVLMGLVVLLLAGSGGRATTSNDPLAGLRGACKEFVSRALHDPASADWGEYWNWTAVDNRDGTYSVGAQYRAKNGFGAIRMAYTTCILRRDGNQIALVKLSNMR